MNEISNLPPIDFGFVEDRSMRILKVVGVGGAGCNAVRHMYDEEEKNYVRVNNNTYIFEGKTLLSDFYKTLDIDSEEFEDIEGDADTLAGLLLEIKGEFPKINEKIEYSNFTFQVLKMDERRIMKIKVTIKP